MKNKAYTQCDAIIEFMTKSGSITQEQANWLGIKRLASRINELRGQGYAITTDSIAVKSRYGTAHVARYRFTNDERSKEE